MKPRPFLMLAWVMVLSLPIYVWGAFYPVRNLPFGLPGTAVMIVLPALVASIMIYREGGRAALAQLWRRLFDIDRIKDASWATLALLTMPAASVVAFVAMRALDLPLPEAPAVEIATIPIAFALYFAGGALEEIGWTGYCTEPLQQRFGVAGAGLIIGSVWAAWHLVPWAIIQDHAVYWLIGEIALTILMRLLMGYIYAHGGGSVFLATLFHAAINTSYSLFPNGGSHYDPVVTAVVLGAAMLLWAAVGRSPN
jgi:membrane protease YdiL (CAAX protease family)